MKPLRTLIITVSLLVVIIGFSSLFTVTQGQHALINRLGKLIDNRKDQGKVFAPGLHFKLPIIERVLKFDTRLQTFDEKSSRIMTKEKKDMLVDYYVKWRIADLPLYYTRTTGDVSRVETLVKQQVDDNLRAQFGRRTIREVISDDRTVIMQLLRESTALDVEKLGVKIIDVRIKAIDLPQEVSQSVFANMRAEREEVAKEHRAKGMAKAEAIRAEADATAKVMVSKARKNADEIRAQGNARAATIYANAYSQNADFYSFYRSLLAYKKTFGANRENILLISPDNQYFKYFKSMDDKKK